MKYYYSVLSDIKTFKNKANKDFMYFKLYLFSITFYETIRFY